LSLDPSNALAQALQKAFTFGSSILFVGCGLGLEDPNFGPLLDWIREVGASDHRHYRLCRDDEVERLEAHHKHGDRVFPLGYGREHSDLAGFLEQLSQLSEQQKSRFAAVPQRDDFVIVGDAQPLLDLIERYEASQQILDMEPRVKEKEAIFAAMRTLLSKQRADKARLYADGRIGCRMAMAAAILEMPEGDDCQLVLQLDPTLVPKGHAQYELFNVVETLLRASHITSWGIGSDLIAWADGLKDLDDRLKVRRGKLKEIRAAHIPYDTVK
jgi:hypothetical protein